MNAWHVTQSKFSKVFTNYTNYERAYNELGQLCMKGSDVDTYIADFKCLFKDADISQDDVNNLWMFAKGLPKGLCKECLVHDDPNTFEAWAMSAQNRQCIWMKEKAIFMNYGSVPQSNNQQQRQQSRWTWCQNEGASGSNNWCNNNQGCQSQGQGCPAMPRLQL
jgi:hypothetical protein